MAVNRFFIQNKFSKASESAVKKLYGLSDDDSPLLAVWAGRIHNQPLRSRGFLFTKRGFAWIFPAIAESGKAGEGAERLRRDFEFLGKAQTKFRLAYIKSDKGLNELYLQTEAETFIFQFTQAFPKEELEKIERITRDYFTGYFDAPNYDRESANDYGLVRLYTIPDFISGIAEKIEDCGKSLLSKQKRQAAAKAASDSAREEAAFSKPEENSGTAQANSAASQAASDSGQTSSSTAQAESAKTQASSSTSQATSASQADSAMPKASPSQNKFLCFLRHCLDLFADLVFASAVIILVKPEILWANSYFKSITIERLSIRIFMNLRSDLPDDFLIQRNLIVTTLFISFIILKLLVITTNKNARKVVPILLIIILGVSSILIPINFLIFLILSLLILLTLQFAMEFPAITIKRKCWLFLVLTLAFYISAHILFDEGLQKSLCQEFSQLFDALNFPAKWW